MLNNRAQRWIINNPATDLCRRLARSLNISEYVSQVLVNRGITTADSAGRFLQPRLGQLHSPFLMKDMQPAVDRIVRAVTADELICIYGDYDVDGITATVLLMQFLGSLGARVRYFIPHRIDQGYGLDTATLQHLHQQGVSLVITVDCGIADVAPARWAAEHGLDLIITDHHLPPDEIAPARAVIDPRQTDCTFPFKALAGVGVAFNLVMALRKTLREQGRWRHSSEPNLKSCLDLVALGTIADMVPMVDENRIFVKAGLAELSAGNRPGIRALKQVCGIRQPAVSCRNVGFHLAPRLNAAGRLANASSSVELLMATDFDQALQLARQIDRENTRRQQIERRILNEARAMIANQPTGDALVLASPAWHPGVLGLCASRLSDEHGCPAILIALDAKSGAGRGSARSIDGFDLYSALKQCTPLLQNFGGHKAAAGLTISRERLDDFTQRFTTIAAEHRHTAPEPTLTIDAEIPLEQLTWDVVRQIESLAPFGPQNPEPVFCSGDLQSYSSMVVGSKHLKFRIRQNGRFIDAIGFNMAEQHRDGTRPIRLAFVPQFNTYNGETCVQLNLKDIQYI